MFAVVSRGYIVPLIKLNKREECVIFSSCVQPEVILLLLYARYKETLICSDSNIQQCKWVMKKERIKIIVWYFFSPVNIAIATVHIMSISMFF